MHGPQAAQRMRAMGVSTPIIGVTGNVLPKDIQAFEDAGADMVMGKPVDPGTMSTCLRNVIARKEKNSSYDL